MAVSSVSPCSSPRGPAYIIREYMDDPKEKVRHSLEHTLALTAIFKSRAQQQYKPMPDEIGCDVVTLEPLGVCVTTPCGHTFNLSTMEKQFAAGQQRCPLHPTPVTPQSLRKNLAVSAQVNELKNGADMIKVFIEVPSLTSNGLEFFNKELWSRLGYFDQAWRFENARACAMLAACIDYCSSMQVFKEPVVATCGHTFEREAVVRGVARCTIHPQSPVPVLEECVTNLILKEAFPHVREYARTASWTEKPLETLAGKAGLFIFLPTARTVQELITDFASVGIFNKAVQLAAARGPEQLRAAIGKFDTVEEQMVALETPAAKSLTVSIKFPDAHSTLVTPDISLKGIVDDILPEPTSQVEDNYIHMTFVAGWDRTASTDDPAAIYNPELLKLLPKRTS